MSSITPPNSVVFCEKMPNGAEPFQISILISAGRETLGTSEANPSFWYPGQKLPYPALKPYIQINLNGYSELAII